MVDTVGEPHALQVTLKGGELFGILVVGIIEVECLQRSTDTQVVATVLVIEDIASPECRFAQAIEQRLLLQTQTVELRYVVAEDFQVIELVHGVLESLLLLTAAEQKPCGSQSDHKGFFH